MSHDEERQRRLEALERVLRLEHDFSLADAIAREAGGGFFAGASAVPAPEAARIAARLVLEAHLAGPVDCLVTVLDRDLEARFTADDLDDPVGGLRALLRHHLRSDAALYELVRRVDVLYGQRMDERPHFQWPGEPPHPDDPYTHAGVRAMLQGVIETLGPGEEA